LTPIRKKISPLSRDCDDEPRNRGCGGIGGWRVAGDKRATLVGERTYGDASVLRPISMDDGSAIILSVAKYYTPDGKSIQDNGVTPKTS